MILLSSLMTSPVITVSRKTRITDAIKIMEKNHISALVITSGERPVGIFTERSLLRKKIAGSLDKDLVMEEVMTPNPVTAELNVNIHEAYLLFLRHKIRHLIATHKDGTLAGILTETDILNGLGIEYFVSFNEISHIATKKVISLKKKNKVSTAMELMNNHHISSIVVVEKKKPIGIVTERDIVRLIRADINTEDTQLKEVMSQPVLTVSHNISAHEAAKLIRKQGVRRLVILKENGKTGGIVTETDIIKGLKSDYIDLLKEVIETQVVQLKSVRQQLNNKIILEAMMHSSTDLAFVITDLGFKILHSNTKAETLYGYSPKEISNYSIQEIFSKEGVSAKQFNRTIDFIHHKGSFDFTHTITSKNHITHIESNIFGIRGDDGKILGYVLIGKDITKQTDIQRHLKKRSQELEETNAALRVLLKQREADREEINKEIQSNVDNLVLPFFSKLRSKPVSDNQKQIIESIEANLRQITSPIAQNISSFYSKLTPAEIQVVNLVKNGHSSKEIADLLNLSPGTVYTHRRNIRKKSGITNKKVNLQTLLQQIE